MDEMLLPDSKIQALIPSSGSSSVWIPMLNPGYPDPVPSTPISVKNQILHMLQSINATQAQQTSTLVDHSNDIAQTRNIVQVLTLCVQSIPLLTPVVLPPAPPAINLPMGPAPVPIPEVAQNPVDPGAGNVKIHPPRIFDGRTSEVEGFLNKMDDCVYIREIGAFW